MSNPQKISKSEYLKEAISDLKKLIERADNSINRHKSLENPDILAIQGFERIRQQYINELELKQLEFIPHIDCNAQYAMGA